MEKVIPIQINLERGELTLPATGLNVIIIPSEIFRELLLTSEEFLASGATVVWSFIGTAAGRKLAEICRRECGILEDEELVRCLSKYFTNLGWGKMSASMFDPTNGVANIEVAYNLFTGQTDKPLCYFIRALISGMFEAIFQKPVECKEIRCVSQGDSCCVFEVRRRSE